MNTRTFCIGIVLMAAVISVAHDAKAAYRYVFDQSNYTVSPGQTVTVRVSLQETETTVFRDDGLIGTGVQVRFDDPPQPSSPAMILTTADIANLSDFELEWTKEAYPNDGYAGLSLGTFGTAYGVETPAGSDIYHVLLGDFTFTAGALGGEVTHLRATDFNTSTDETIYYRNGDIFDPVALDSLIMDATATITTVPESGTLLLSAIAALCLLGHAWRKGSNLKPFKYRPAK